MVTMAEGEERSGGEEALRRLRTVDPATYLSPSPELSWLAREASTHLFSSLLPFCPGKPPLDQLLAGESFDAEQVWYQIDLLSRPLLPMLRRYISRLEKEPLKQQAPAPAPSPSPSLVGKIAGNGKVKSREEDDDEEEEEEEEDDDDDVEDEDGVEVEEDEDDDDAVDDEDDDEEDEEEEERLEKTEEGAVEDKFLKLNELEKFLEEGEQLEFANNNDDKKKKNKDEDGDEDEDEDGKDDFGHFGEDEDEEDIPENARYGDFFGGKGNKKEKSSKKKVHFQDMEESEDQHTDDENEKKNLSTHEKEMQKLQSKIKQMEKANLEPKTWAMQGEVTAARRPVNSALEVDLDFEHNAGPAPVITEEITASLEDLIKKRIIEGQFDDVEKAPALPTKAPKELKELDENKSKKGLAELYEEEYAQKAGLAPAPLSVSDELKKEADTLFKKICLKLDALSHFHFAPKPVLEEMSVQVNVPALAMEEIAPVAVSDAAMLAPEEIYEGKGDIREEGELTQSDRKRRRANKKRKFKAEAAKRATKKPRETANVNGQ